MAACEGWQPASVPSGNDTATHPLTNTIFDDKKMAAGNLNLSKLLHILHDEKNLY